MFRSPWVTGMIMALMGYSLAELLFAPTRQPPDDATEVEQGRHPTEPGASS